jgi:hypothetical protein
MKTEPAIFQARPHRLGNPEKLFDVVSIFREVERGRKKPGPAVASKSYAQRDPGEAREERGFEGLLKKQCEIESLPPQSKQ